MPKISVILPNYNHALFLKERIDSILNQTYQDFELIILDDYSTDNSKDILHEYREHPKVKCIIINNQNSNNTFIQWDKGIKLSKGKYIWIAESDDFASNIFLEKNINALESSSQAVMSLSGSFYVDENSKVLKKSTRDRWKETGVVKEFDGIEYIKANLSYRNNVYNASMVVFRRDIYDLLDKSFQQLRCGGDWLFWVEVAKQGNVLEIREKLNYFRRHLNKVTIRGAHTGEGEANMLEIMRSLLSINNISSYKKMMMKGECWRQIYRSKASNDIKKDLFIKGKKKIGLLKVYYYFYIINRYIALFLPFLSTPKNDKMK